MVKKIPSLVETVSRQALDMAQTMFILTVHLDTICLNSVKFCFMFYISISSASSRQIPTCLLNDTIFLTDKEFRNNYNKIISNNMLDLISLASTLRMRCKAQLMTDF